MLTRTGRYPLLMMVLLLAVLLILIGCSSPEPVVVPEPEVPQDVEEPVAETPEELAETEAPEQLHVFTLEELAEYDGLDGRPAYVAVDGLVYDFTELERWVGGEHFGYQAGQDLTEALHTESPHGDSVLDRAPVVGRLSE